MLGRYDGRICEEFELLRIESILVRPIKRWSGGHGGRLTVLINLNDLFVAAIEASFAMIRRRYGRDG